MSEGLGAQAREYISVLETYFNSGDESELSRAYELGRRAMSDGSGVLDMASRHGKAVDALLASIPAAEQPRFLRAASEVLNELLSPFEMAFRGYRDANRDLQRLNETLRQQKAAVEFANQELESFSHSVSHDLRAPLRGIDGYTHIILEDFGDTLHDDARKNLLTIQESTRHMARLIDAMLSLSRVKFAGVEFVDVDLTDLARRIVERLSAQSPGREAEFVIMDGLRARGDPKLLGILLQNLLGNAWKFTSRRAAAKITFGREERDGQPAYLVRDNGAGFDMADAAKLFGTFQRLHSQDEFEGTGIGLAIVQRVVRRHEGRVWAEGKVDAGATIYFTLGAGG